ncbi:type III effector [Ralstonia pseudosolanacearum]|uniref:type III effector n=1 Tax=Ralstonia pseudosolanacearum TaxID=1310165 RepID=UPI0009C045A1|nr:type III effector [Ralstonia pseudosolanacearum]MCL1622634.1 type III effector [Ralstonia pseudosolanacearum CaRs-Mep]
MFKKILGGGESSTSWNALTNVDRDNVVKTHESVAAQSLGLGGYSHQTVRVTPSTLQNLKAASWANRVAKNVMEHGAGNQRVDIHASNGESWARSEAGAKKYPSRLERAQKEQGGNCHVFTDVATAALHSGNAPEFSGSLHRVWLKLPTQPGAAEKDHVFATIGDPDRTPAKDVVVVDAWPGHPSACTLDRATLVDASTGEHHNLANLLSNRNTRYLNSQVAPNRADSERLTKIKPMSTSDVNKQLRKMGVPEVGSQLVHHVEQQAHAQTGTPLFDVRVATDPSTRYTDGTSYAQTFDAVSVETLSKQQAGRGSR